MEIGQPTADQIRIFLAVVDCGSFNAAAKRLGRAISAVSYGIANLEAQLGVSLFDREGSKKPELTPAGRAVLAEARGVADSLDALVAKVKDHARGLESELTLVIDVMYPSRALALILSEFAAEFPTVDLRLRVEALGAVTDLVVNGSADLGINGPLIEGSKDLEMTAIGGVELIPVAAPGHPLARLETVPVGESRRHLQIVLTDRSPLTEGRDFSVLSARTWRLADLGSKHALLLEGIGWGNMPRHLVAADLSAGRLKQLAIPEGCSFTYALNAIWRRDRLPGPAQCWMLEALGRRLEG